MGSLQDTIRDIVESVQVGDGLDEPLVGQPLRGVGRWKPEQETLDAAEAYGFGQGRKPFYPLSSPNGREIGFPFPEPRPFQLESVDSICNAFVQGNDVLFEAGTGFGKSPMEIGVVSQFSSAYLLIGRNDLVDQWEHDFEDFADIGFYKARHRFDCEVIMGERGKLNCSQAKTPCSKKRKNAKEHNQHCPACPYAVSRDVALSKPFTVMTLSLGLTVFKYMSEHPGLDKRDVLIIDECSELESEIMRFFEFQASTKSVFKAIEPTISMGSFFPLETDEFFTRWPMVTRKMSFGEALPLMKPENNLRSCALWAIEIAGLAARRKEWTRQGNEEQEKIAENCENIARMANNMLECINAKIPHYAEVTAGEDKNDQQQYTVRVSPLEARTMLETLAAPFAEHLLFVSATTGTAEMFTAAHGYTRPLVKIESPSGFPVANRPIYPLPAGNMSQKTQHLDAPKVMQKLVQIVKNTNDQNTRFDHANQKGIIHTYNNKVTDMVLDALKAAGQGHRALPLRGSGRAREEVMKIYKGSSEPLILVSPSAMLGLSLNDDLGRWQAIVKIPYAYLGDQSVAHRKANIYGWYEWQTAKDLIQTFGRIVRSDTDWGSTYILDDAFERFYLQNWQLFPQYIRDAIWRGR